ncbi:hypothetical protein KDW19_17545 [Burkholderia cenocepacia]|uniref:hypothetical protein n=1 Tax=Burkholderia cepacia complex TaxID=87882 RepID=UPI000980EEFC|nr:MULTISPECIES: hypothetical protein [Burkholderia cepacia complex]AQQ31424.1 hypothetical protein A8E96_03050 [Burkholderia cenocepacia]ELW9447603.1 hypothetical protein [Burkholderia cenocepacia]MBR8079169.1 hypothetical protein [Burkholderia cenocepacia]MBR8293343.1 hypothetical protein [Burkholderia cenocepacia]MBR8484255.1 hypothetical protein [Burkholderia cenocepacia]
MSFEYRGFVVSTDVLPDDAGIQWYCSSRIDGVDRDCVAAVLPPVELTISRLKIDVLMAISMIEHRAKDSVDEWFARK